MLLTTVSSFFGFDWPQFTVLPTSQNMFKGSGLFTIYFNQQQIKSQARDLEFYFRLSSTSLFHSKENVGVTHELQTNKETLSIC